MLQKIDRKKYIFFYFIIFLILSSIHNSNFKYNKFFAIKKIDVVWLNESNNLLLENKLVDFIGYNIFTLEKDSFKFIDSLNLIKDYNIKTKEYQNVMKIALKAHKVLKCRGVTRSDFKFHNGKFYLLETNTQPGMTNLSLVPEIAQYHGVNFFSLIDWIIKDASKNR